MARAWRLWLALGTICLSCGLALAAEPPTVAVYECRRCAQPPVIDGKLDDACWQGLPVMDTFYQYWSPTPKPPPLKTAARACFDDTGFYLGITLWDEHLDTIKATITDRDNPITWMDDCVEIMVDPYNTGDSYFKFTTNLNAARYDEKATNLELDGGWNVEGWKVATSKGQGVWFIEFSLPWTDISAKPREGDVWSFDFVRYSFSTGVFRGVSWSLGGSGAAPQSFGYLGFGSLSARSVPDLERIARAAKKTKGDAFCVLTPDFAVIRDATGSWSRHGLSQWAAQPLSRAAGALKDARGALASAKPGEEKKQLETRLSALQVSMDELRSKLARPGLAPADAAVLRQSALALTRDALDAKWSTYIIGLTQ